MKNKFLPHRLLQLSLLISNSVICCHPVLLHGSANHWSTDKKNELRDEESSFKWLDKAAARPNASKETASKQTNYHTPGQIIFSIGEESSAPQKTINRHIFSQKSSTANSQAIAQVDSTAERSGEPPETVLINFNNISIIEYIRFISRIVNKNFVFDENDLQFNVTIISEEPATLENIMTALLQELRIHGLTLIEQGNNLIIHRNPKVNAISQIVTDDITGFPQNSEIITQVFKLNTAKPGDVANVIRPLTSEFALIEVLEGTNHLIITDLSTNVEQIAKLIKSVDAPASGLVIGQYVVRATTPELLIEMAKSIIAPISQDQPLTIVSWEPSRSIFIVSTPFLVERTLSILQHLDQNQKTTRVFDLKELQYSEAAAEKEAAPSGLYINSQPFETPPGANIPGFPGVPRIPSTARSPTPSDRADIRRGTQRYPGFPQPGSPQASPSIDLNRPDSFGRPSALPGTRGFPESPSGVPSVIFPGTAEFPATGTPLPGTDFTIDETTGEFIFSESADFPERTFTGTDAFIPDEESIIPGRWFRDSRGRWSFPLGKAFGRNSSTPPEGQWKIDGKGNWYFEPSTSPPKQGKWRQDQDGNWLFIPNGVPAGDGMWKQDQDSKWYYQAGQGPLEGGRWVQQDDGRWRFEPSSVPSRLGTWKQDIEGNWYLEASPNTPIPADLKEENLPHPSGHWYYDPINGWIYELDPGEAIGVKRLVRDEPLAPIIPYGAKQKAQFYVYKVKYRRGDTIQGSLNAIADSLASAGPDSADLLATLTSVQWIETSNSLIFTGLEENLLKMRELMAEIDVPLRQVFIEMLVLETSMNDSLEYGVTWGTRFGGGNWAGGQQFGGELSPIGNALASTPSPGGLGSSVDNTLLNSPNTTTSTISGSNLGTGLGQGIIPVRAGLDMGVIGQTLINTSMGLQFNSISALLHVLRTKVNSNVILSPKIITEDNVPAEIFVGENVSFKTQSLANDQNNTITNNFEYRDVGTRLRVTPSIGNNDIISLEIAQEISRIIPSTVPRANDNNAPGPSTSKSTTTTRVHLPDGYFLIISGMMNDQNDRFSTQVPCLGAIPVLGAAFKDKIYDDRKRNQMIFIRPRIIDTEEEIQNLTKHEQDIWDYKHRRKNDWIYETEQAFDFLNLKRDVEEVDPELAGRDN